MSAARPFAALALPEPWAYLADAEVLFVEAGRLDGDVLVRAEVWEGERCTFFRTHDRQPVGLQDLAGLCGIALDGVVIYSRHRSADIEPHLSYARLRGWLQPVREAVQRVLARLPTPPIDIPAVYRYVGSVLAELFPTSTREDRDEIKQEVALRLIGRDDIRRPAAYGGKMGRNLMIDWRRTETARRQAETALAWMGSRTVASRWEERTHAAMDLERAQRLLDTAPPQYRELLRRLVIEGEEIEDVIASEIEARGQESTPASFALARDAVYKRRMRAFQWMARHGSAA